MIEKRFSTNGSYIYDTFHDGIKWLANEVEVQEIVEKMNNLDLKARERSKALSKLQKENEQLKKELQRMYDVATLNKAIEVLENKYDKMLSDGSDEVKDAMRHTVLRCIEDLDELKDDITAR